MCVGTPRNSRGPPFGGGRNRPEPSKEAAERIEGTGLLESFHGLTEIIRKINMDRHIRRGGGLGSRPKKMYGERLGDGVEYHLMSPTPRC